MAPEWGSRSWNPSIENTKYFFPRALERNYHLRIQFYENKATFIIQELNEASNQLPLWWVSQSRLAFQKQKLNKDAKTNYLFSTKSFFRISWSNQLLTNSLIDFITVWNSVKRLCLRLGISGNRTCDILRAESKLSFECNEG